MSAAAHPQLHTPQHTILGHPVGLYFLFFTEMWERFSFYGMRALLILYMTDYFRMSQKDASVISKIYTTFVYVTPILGGILADRVLGNRWAVIIGAVLMAFGHFMMAFDNLNIFYGALLLLILGNGFFKPNMSTQVGRLYPPGDNRRDGAYTIFYMGINLGAGMAPILCGWLQENTMGGFHSGFSAAGIGMVLGLIIYLVGQPFIREIQPNATDLTPTTSAPKQIAPADETATMTEEQVEKVPSVLGKASSMIPILLVSLGVALVAGGPIGWRFFSWDGMNATILSIGGGCLLIFSMIVAQVRGGLRDRVVTILILGFFLIFFWGAFEQASNVLTQWADKSTNRYLTQPMSEATLFPPEKKEKTDEVEETDELSLDRFFNQFRLKPRTNDTRSDGNSFLDNLINPIPTTFFLSINAVFIVILAPLFAWLWVALDSRGFKLSIPVKMVFGLLMVSAAMVVMAASAREENLSASVAWTGNFPTGVGKNELNQVSIEKKGKFEPFHAGRLTYDAKDHKLNILGVLPNTEARAMIAATAPEQFRSQIKILQLGSGWIGGSQADGAKQKEEQEKIWQDKIAKATTEERKQLEAELDWLKHLTIRTEKQKDTESVISVGVKLEPVPPGFDMHFAELPKSALVFSPEEKLLVARKSMTEKEVKGLSVAAGAPEFRKTVEALFTTSARARVSAWWLFWAYILATVGELCLSPVGLSMVSKLAPTRYAAMLMGVWLMTNAFGNYAAGYLGELWGTIPPTEFFLYVAGGVFAAALVLLALVHWVVRSMHGVR